MQFQKAKAYVLKRLEKELNPNLYYHGLHHTIDVCEAVERLAGLEKIKGNDLVLLKTAALYHDFGFVLKYKANEDGSAVLAQETLPQFGYSHKEIEIVSNCIIATQIPQRPKTILEKILCDADLDYIGRDDFFMVALKLHREWSEHGIQITLKEWYLQQLDFVSKHQYWTNAAKTLRQQKKELHLYQIKELLVALEDHERRILPSKDNFSLICENLQHGIYIIKDNLLLYVNNALAETFGYTPEQLFHVNFYDLVFPEDKIWVEERINGCVESLRTALKFKFRGITKKNKTVFLEFTSNITMIEGGLALTGTIINISDQTEEENSAIKVDERYRQLIEHFPIGIYRTTPAGKIILANRKLVELLGYKSFAELKSRNLDLEGFEFSYPRQTFKQLMQDQGYVKGFEYVWVKKDGTRIYIRENASTTKNKDGEIIYYEGTIEDITESIETGEAIKELNSSLSGLSVGYNKLTTTYGKFFPSEFVSLLKKSNITELKLGDNIRKEMTILFSDIRAFTTLSETMKPEQNFKFINSYLNKMGPIIRKNKGYIDKYIGDSIMALFPNTVENALSAAIESHEKVKIYNRLRMQQGYKPIKVGIGIHFGELMLGVIGEESRMQATVISDNVNLASRIEGLTKVYNAGIIISENVLQKIKKKENYLYRFLGNVLVKGKTKSVYIFELFSGDREEVIEMKIKTKSDFEKGIYLFQEEQFSSALSLFQNVIKINPYDKAAVIFLSRCEKMIKYGIPPDWDSVEIMRKK